MNQLLMLSIFMFVCALSVQAGELVYAPVNPAFGGSPLNGNWLLNNAQAQNDKTDPADDIGREEETSLDRFNDMMERLVLSRLASVMIDQFTLEVDGETLLVAGSYTLGDFQVDIVDVNDILTVTTTDTTTGQTTEFVIDQSL